MKIIISKLFIIIILLLPVLAIAESKEIVSEGTYNMGDGETPSVAESRALLNAKRNALEEAGTYVESYSKVENLQLTKDEIKVLASGLMEVTVLEKKRAVIGSGFHFWVKIKAIVTLDKIKDMAQRVKEKNIAEDYKKIQAAYTKSQKEIEELKKELIHTKKASDIKIIESKIKENERDFQANQFLEKASIHFFNGNWTDCLSALNSYISLNQNNADAYKMRGLIFQANELYSKALDDFDRAMTIDPNNVSIYDLRGNMLLSTGQHEKAINDFNKAEQIYNKYLSDNPTDADAYYGRGIIYNSKKQYDKAISDFTKAIEINSNNYSYYYYRAITYNIMKQYENAMKDYTMALKIVPHDANLQLVHAVQWHLIGHTDRAFEEINKIILNYPNFALAYHTRGEGYDDKGQYDKSYADYKRACDLGLNASCKILSNRK